MTRKISKPKSTRKRTSVKVGGERFTPFTVLKPDEMDWSEQLDRSERVDWKAVQRKIDSGDVVMFDDIDIGHVQESWIDVMHEKLGKLNTRFLYVDEHPGRLFVMSPAVADELHIDDVYDDAVFATS